MRDLNNRRPRWRSVKALAFQLGSHESRFARIYSRNHWGGSESLSGPGSSLAETAVIRSALPELVVRLGVRTLLDVPCGDFHWMRELTLDIDEYIGGDIVGSVVEANRDRYGDDRHSFIRLDILKDEIPLADLVVCRDLLDHLSLADVCRALVRIAGSGSSYVLASTYPTRRTNPEVLTGSWRPLNLEIAPFGLPTPLELIDEKSEKPGYADKSLGLWRVSDIPIGSLRAAAESRLSMRKLISK